MKKLRECCSALHLSFTKMCVCVCVCVENSSRGEATWRRALSLSLSAPVLTHLDVVDEASRCPALVFSKLKLQCARSMSWRRTTNCTYFTAADARSTESNAISVCCTNEHLINSILLRLWSNSREGVQRVFISKSDWLISIVPEQNRRTEKSQVGIHSLRNSHPTTIVSHRSLQYSTSLYSYLLTSHWVNSCITHKEINRSLLSLD